MERKKGIYERFFKRPLDFILALSALIALSPVMLVVAVLVRVKLGSPIVFCQERPGLNEKIFKMYKFRSMTDERDENGELLPDSVRLTKFGKWLRSTSLDELPELWNIVIGDMSIVGPRPLLVQYLPFYTENEKRRHEMRPGLTGFAQISGRNFIEWDKRLEKDVQYVEKICFKLDLSIIFSTVKMVCFRSNIAVDSDSIEGNLAQIRLQR